MGFFHEVPVLHLGSSFVSWKSHRVYCVLFQSIRGLYGVSFSFPLQAFHQRCLCRHITHRTTISVLFTMDMSVMGREQELMRDNQQMS